MRRTALIFSVLLLAASALALKEEQMGTFDWYRQFVGKVTHAQFAPGNRPRVYVTTAANVVAAINLRDGEIIWRQVLEESDAVEALAVLEDPPTVVTLSSGGRHLRGWSPNDGGLLWEEALAAAGLQSAPSGPASMLVVKEGVAGAANLVVLAGTTLKAYSVGPGAQQLWTWQVAPQWASALSSRLYSDGAAASAIALLDGGMTAELVLRELATGEVMETMSAASSVPLAAPLLLRSGRTLVALSAEGSQLCSAAVKGDGSAAAFSCAPLDNKSGTGATLLATDAAASSPVVALKAASRVSLYSVAQGKPALQEHLHGASAATARVGAATDLLAVAGCNTAHPWLKVINAESGAVEHEEAVEGVAGHLKGWTPGQLAAAFVDSYSRKGGSRGYRALLVGDDHALVLGQQGRAVWGREEALAGVTASLQLDLPTRRELASEGTPAPTFQQRLHYQTLSLKDNLYLLKPEEKVELGTLRAELNTKMLPTRDANGFRRLLLVHAAAAGKLAALHNGDGHVVWSRRIPPAPGGGAGGEQPAGSWLLPWRTSHDVTHAPEVLLLQSGATESSYAVVNGHSGAQLSAATLPFHITQVVELPQHLWVGTTEQRIYLLVSRSSNSKVELHLLPDSPTAAAVFDTMRASVHFWLADADSGVISGYGIGPDSQPVQLWSSVYAPRRTNSILATTARDPSEPVHSHAKVLGNRDLKIKYLNPNVLFVASGVPDDVPTNEVDSSRTTLRIDLLDSVTGRPIFRQAHQNARGPVQVVVAEHWVVYSYHDLANSRFAMSVVELYDASPRDFNLVKLAFSTPNETLSSYAAVPLEVTRQSFFFWAQVTAMAVTRTARGVTSKFLLLGTALDQARLPGLTWVYTLDKRLVDPRRPHHEKLTPEEIEERLMPYRENLPMAVPQFVTYNRAVARLKGIVSAESVLESTSLVFAHGLDLFYTRVQPSAAFDSLQDDFPYALLVLLTTAVGLAVVATQVLAARKDVKVKWA